MSPAPKPSATRPGASSSIVAMEEAVTEGWRVTGLTSSVPRLDRRGCLGGGGEEDVGVAATELGIGQPGGVPAEGLDSRHIFGEGCG